MPPGTGKPKRMRRPENSEESDARRPKKPKFFRASAIGARTKRARGAGLNGTLSGFYIKKRRRVILTKKATAEAFREKEFIPLHSDPVRMGGGLRPARGLAGVAMSGGRQFSGRVLFDAVGAVFGHFLAG